ncbi:phosphomannomutase [Novosphingobium sp. FSW06-99]|uniref:phosphomannomutase n=1 Tax=Novosphingobium sp. FSW06-99 TaxID=1739113 RepID=UPI00076C614F|nr:phosphomannomutase [Novosphingobium sp. FSW06-99]KUR76485.1 phosphomannomutase [Novosphingobium sp. FSW06-99]
MTITVKALMQECGVAFGTSGARGLVSAMTDRVCYGYTAGFLGHMADAGEFAPGGRVALAGDLRPSTPRILAACARAVRDLGGVPVFCGYVPTPALALYAFAEHIPSLMVTGSHIPADRNGIKFYRSAGEVLKADEAGMSAQVVDLDGGRFDAAGMLVEPEALPPVTDVGKAYVQRYIDHFGRGALTGKRIGVYQHSAVGRDILARILTELGAEIELLGRSDVFVPVDTEAIRPEDVVLARQWAAAGALDAIVSTDGDSDRPLIADETGKWLRGDVLGILCAAGVGATSVVTPVSSNSAVEASGRFARVLRTRIGSPYVISAMDAELAAGADCVVGYEANGGFLLGSAIPGKTGTTRALPTRDAVLPMLIVLTADAPGVAAQLASLPARYTYSDRITPFPPEASASLFAQLTAGDEADRIALQTRLFGAFAGAAQAIDMTDGVRTRFAGGGVIHLRGSGNAPELRCYTEAGSEAEAVALNADACAAIRGLLRL